MSLYEERKECNAFLIFFLLETDSMLIFSAIVSSMTVNVIFLQEKYVFLKIVV